MDVFGVLFLIVLVHSIWGQVHWAWTIPFLVISLWISAGKEKKERELVKKLEVLYQRLKYK